MNGKIVALSDPKASLKQQQRIMGEQIDEDIDQDAYVSVELTVNHEIVNVRRKRIILMSEKEKYDSKKKKSRSRSRSRDKKKDKK